jgi:hypothetical protein
MASSGMLRRVVLVKTDVSEECSASIIKVARIGELGTTLAVTSNLLCPHHLLCQIIFKPVFANCIIFAFRDWSQKFAVNLMVFREFHLTSSLQLLHITQGRTSGSTQLKATRYSSHSLRTSIKPSFLLTTEHIHVWCIPVSIAYNRVRQGNRT